MNKNPDKNGHFSIKDIYKFYKSTCKQSKPIDFKTYGNLIRDFNVNILNKIIYSNFEFHFPGRLGTLRIQKSKPKIVLKEDGKLNTNQLPIDWKKSKELGKRVYHLNRHFDGYRTRWYWNKRNSNVRNQSVYRLDMARWGKLELAKAIINTDIKVDYYE